MKSLLIGSLLMAAGVATAAVTEVRFEPNGVPAFLGRNDLQQGKLVVVADKEAKQEYVRVSITGTKPADVKTIRAGEVKGSVMGDKLSFRLPVKAGTNEFPVKIEPSPKADIGRKVVLEGKAVRLGSLVTRPGQKVTDAGRNSKNFRIPGIVETPKGTLVAVFDNRFNHAGDLPADITVGVSVSKDKGNTWSPIRTAISCKDLPGGSGIGDPAILCDPSNGRIWVAALRAPNAGHPIWKSSTGTADPKACGQFILAYSDNEGQSWSKPINITEEIKRLADPDTKDWGLVFQGPGAGIAMTDGTLVFPAQIWGNKGSAPHHGVLVYSKDHGKTWASSKAMPFGGSESTVAETTDGALLLNTREGGGGLRVTGRTTDLGQTWTKLEPPPLRQPVCQGALLAMNKKLYFSNPNSGKRDTMTVRASADDGKTWNAGIVYDPRGCAGYSSLCSVGEDSLGVLYEGNSDYLYFLRIPLAEIDGE